MTNMPMIYDRAGLYIKRKIKTRSSNKPEEKKIDWVNIALFVLLFVVIVLFVVMP